MYCNDRFYFIPDIVKIITNLGRHDLRNVDHIMDYRKSLVDLTSSLNDQSIYWELSKSINERYPSDYSDLTIVFQSLLTIINNKNLFLKLYYTNPTDVICTDPSRSKLD